MPRSIGLSANASASRQLRGEKLAVPRGTAGPDCASRPSGVIAQVRAGSNPFVSESARHAAGSAHSIDTPEPASERAIRVAWASKAVTRAEPPDHGWARSAPYAEAANAAAISPTATDPSAMSHAATERRMA